MFLSFNGLFNRATRVCVFKQHSANRTSTNVKLPSYEAGRFLIRDAPNYFALESLNRLRSAAHTLLVHDRRAVYTRTYVERIYLHNLFVALAHRCVISVPAAAIARQNRNSPEPCFFFFSAMQKGYVDSRVKGRAAALYHP